MDDYRHTPSDEFEAFKRGEIGAADYLDEVEPELVDVLAEQAAAARERAETSARVDELLNRGEG
jgi:GAF domain-containing protein